MVNIITNHNLFKIETKVEPVPGTKCGVISLAIDSQDNVSAVTLNDVYKISFDNSKFYLGIFQRFSYWNICNCYSLILIIYKIKNKTKTIT